ncbi:hypothetical protein DZF91_02345 [Actinomadura logoneensis]|uniref:Uncharacterized protein n=1 Tax=Actinomadura logoneensis TaxID=2293572 RepID=A0A372JT74_9ACTN|nr:hypothetical protein DZF91_02345 [Actinomadura logoneensis]
MRLAITPVIFPDTTLLVASYEVALNFHGRFCAVTFMKVPAALEHHPLGLAGELNEIESSDTRSVGARPEPDLAVADATALVQVAAAPLAVSFAVMLPLFTADTGPPGRKVHVASAAAAVTAMTAAAARETEVRALLPDFRITASEMMTLPRS